MYSVQDTAEAVGFPIRKSADQSLFAAPRGLSQRTTSFIASQRQGIHRMPLRHLITLIVDARQRLVDAAARQEKTSVLRDLSDRGRLTRGVHWMPRLLPPHSNKSSLHDVRKHASTRDGRRR